MKGEPSDDGVTMNTNHFELFVAQFTPALNLRWIMTGEGLRMQWAPGSARQDTNILPFSAPTDTYTRPAAA